MPLFQSESKCENDFDLHENETACRTHFHMKASHLRTRFETEAQENSEMAYWLWVLMQIVLLKVSCWKRIVQKCKWLSFRDNEFHFDQNENTFSVNECQRTVLFFFWWFWMLTHNANVILERSLRANESHIGVDESILTVMKQIWKQMNVYFL